MSVSTAAAHKLYREDSLIGGGGRFPGIVEGRYAVRLAENEAEKMSVYRLRHDVFNVELARQNISAESSRLEFDAYDHKCRHLIVICRDTGETVGTYRMNTIESAGSAHGFYSSNEFTIGDLPPEILPNGIEIGRACIAADHRNTKVLFLLWKGLLAYLAHSKKQYFFGCCSIFSRDEELGRKAFRQLFRDGWMHDQLFVTPCHDGISLTTCDDDASNIELPSLFNMYLRIGAKICGPPMIDRDFGTIDFFVVFDVNDLNAKYRKMFS